MSGGSVVLLCTVTTDTITQLQWLNGTVSLDDSSRVHITQPYQLYSGTWQAAMEVVVLTPHSGWYYCRVDSDGMQYYGSIQLSVQDIGKPTHILLCLHNYTHI